MYEDETRDVRIEGSGFYNTNFKLQIHTCEKIKKGDIFSSVISLTLLFRITTLGTIFVKF